MVMVNRKSVRVPSHKIGQLPWFVADIHWQIGGDRLLSGFSSEADVIVEVRGIKPRFDFFASLAV
jgi:hypothetical protein